MPVFQRSDGKRRRLRIDPRKNRRDAGCEYGGIARCRGICFSPQFLAIGRCAQGRCTVFAQRVSTIRGDFREVPPQRFELAESGNKLTIHERQ
mmetsp:Transcript_24234/g.75028  ORF Transcript_24234/g.75028 Transcript_24234/m.75028 type:complete len:93 (-) Transcript_24234:18-296(-)